MIEILGDRQKQLLKLLLTNKSGLTVDELSKGLKITRNAVRQHLAALERDGLISPGATRPSGGGRSNSMRSPTRARKFFRATIPGLPNS